MSTAKVIEIIAGSTQGFDDALQEGVKDASRSLRGISGVKVVNWTVDVQDNKIVNYKVTLHVAFKLEE